MTTYTLRAEPKVLRFSLTLFAFAALAMLLAAGWLRFFVPATRHSSRVRDVSWLARLEH